MHFQRADLEPTQLQRVAQFRQSLFEHFSRDRPFNLEPCGNLAAGSFGRILPQIDPDADLTERFRPQPQRQFAFTFLEGRCQAAAELLRDLSLSGTAIRGWLARGVRGVCTTTQRGTTGLTRSRGDGHSWNWRSRLAALVAFSLWAAPRGISQGTEPRQRRLGTGIGTSCAGGHRCVRGRAGGISTDITPRLGSLIRLPLMWVSSSAHG